ncbi:thiolase family protein [Bacteriovoracaceae bacterium]|nr:thiolase family protein [Bacteriovoracaceae bacterium]
MTGKKIYIIAGKRTPFGKFGGSLAQMTPVDLAVNCSQEAMNEAGVKPESIDHVILGNVVPSSTDTLYGARHLTLKLGIPQEVPGYVLNRLCGSGIQVMWEARNMIAQDEASCVLVSGTENMSMVPHLTYGGRFGTKYGALKNVDMLLDALRDKYTGITMGETAEKLAKEYGISREDCDQFSYESHKKANMAYDNGFLQGELTKIELKKHTCERDEHLRTDVSLEGMAKLRPSFESNGTVTPGSASGIVDGASSIIIASEDYCNKHGITPLAEILDFSVVGVDPTIMGIGPVPAIRQLLEKNNKSLSDIDLIEINEAFAAQALSCQKELQIPKEKLNIWGGAIALGHPLAASGTRIAFTLARQLKQTSSEIGIASACIGGGQGIGVLLKNVK